MKFKKLLEISNYQNTIKISKANDSHLNSKPNILTTEFIQ